MNRNKLLEVAFVIIAIFAGFNLQLNWFSLMWEPNKYTSIRDFAQSESWPSLGMTWRLIIGSVVFPIALYAFRHLIYFVLGLFKAFKNNIDKYSRNDAIAYMPLIFTFTGYFGLVINFFIIISLFLIIQSYLIFKIYAEYNQIDMNSGKIKNNRLFILFFISGFAALIYQVVWQRALFQFFGVNIESVTVIVSDFMFGLGLGALLGGYLSKKNPNYLPHLFITCEGLIGIFGFFSLKLFGLINSMTLHSSQLTMALTVYIVLALPTICMGATLPILIEYFHKRILKVGKTVSFLYFINTIGSALASFFTVEVLFMYFGMQFSTIFASLCNLTVAVMGAVFIRQNLSGESIQENVNNVNLNPDNNNFSKMRFYFILILACITGFIAMSQEILWIRFVSFASAGRSTVFALIVGSILVGIAFGSIVASWICEKYKDRLMAVVAINLLIASIIYFLSIPVLSECTVKFKPENVVLMMYVVAGLIAFLMGMTLPILSQYAIHSNQNVGLSVSWIYFANIIGSTVGPILTGFFLLDWISFEMNVLLLSILTWVLALVLWVLNIKFYSIKYIYKPILLVTAFLAFVFFKPLFNHVFEKVQNKDYYDGQSFKYIVQNRSGIITITKQEKGDDIIAGGGTYDGRFNTSLANNNNMIERAYMVAGLKTDLTDVLEIGLSSGSWTRVVANNKNVKHLDVVEINPGYIDLISKYPEQRTILYDNKIKIHIDDGRRWLKRSDKRFDFILMNTTYYWRDQINNLVSREFIQLCKNHLKEGGVLYYNTTGSPDIPYTSATIFKYVTRFINFIAVSDYPFLSDSVLRRKNLSLFYQNNMPIFNVKDSLMASLLNNYSALPFNNYRESLLSESDRYLITDDNLASEFKTNSSPYIKNRSWYLIFHQ